MNLVEFKRSVDSNKLVEAKTVEQTNMRNNVKVGTGYYFQALTKSDEVISLEGSSWDDVFKKLPIELKRVHYAEYSI